MTEAVIPLCHVPFIIIIIIIIIIALDPVIVVISVLYGMWGLVTSGHSHSLLLDSSRISPKTHQSCVRGNRPNTGRQIVMEWLGFCLILDQTEYICIVYYSKTVNGKVGEVFLTKTQPIWHHVTTVTVII